MKVRFTKMDGAGNDFVMIDNRLQHIELRASTVRWLCDRRRGVGADGVIMVEPADGADFRMRYYNRDGGEVDMCGNGARCISVFAAGLGLGRPAKGGTEMSFFTPPGRISATARGDRAAVVMIDATDYQQAISLQVARSQEIVHFINAGVPHVVAVVANASEMSGEEVTERGRGIRLHSEFAPGGANADFVSVSDGGGVTTRTYERGVEAETLACGTGAVAVSVVLSHLGKVASPVEVMTRGGDILTVTFDKTKAGARHVVLEGPAVRNFDGEVELPIEE